MYDMQTLHAGGIPMFRGTYLVLVCLWYDIIDITGLLHMIYVLWLVLHGNSGRAVAAIWLCTICDRYSITFILPAFL